MVRFAVTISAAMLVLTAAAAVWIIWADAPEGVEYLRAEDLSNVGMKPANFRGERSRPGEGVTAHAYRCDFADSGLKMEAEALIGSPPSRYEEEFARGQAEAKVAGRPSEETVQLKAETFGREARTLSFAVIRTRSGPQGGDVTVEWWIQEGDNSFHTRFSERSIEAGRFAERRDWCERQARTIAHTMLGYLREAQSR